MKISELIEALTDIQANHGDLICGGARDFDRVRLIVYDDLGNDVVADADHCGPAYSVYIEVT